MNAIEVKDVYKSFKIYYDKGATFKEKMLFKNRNRHEVHEVLKGISLDIKKGEVVGLIGENGCGKSTLLKLMTRIIYPDKGIIEVNGKISSLLELGAGFHPDMSGRENIYTNASIFGLSKKQIDRRIDDIIRFSELGEFIDNPVRTYSSGMYMRLAFSVAINVDADILLIDEILAVGDAAFQAKCFNKLRQIKAKGTTIVIVSHALSQIEQICSRSIWIEDGSLKMMGLPREVHPYYLDYMGEKSTQSLQENTEQQIDTKDNTSTQEENEDIDNKIDQQRWGTKEAIIEDVYFTNSQNEKISVLKTDEDLNIIIHYRAKQNIEKAVAGIGIFRNDEVYCYGTNTLIDRCESITLKRKGKVICKIKQLNLLPGEYKLDVAFVAENGLVYDYYKGILEFTVSSNIQDFGVTRLNHTWCTE